MSKVSRRKLFLAGLGVIVLTNAVVLFGAAWNRSGAPESELQLTQRELQIPYWGINRESSGAAFNLIWRTLEAETKDAGYWSSGGSPSWLDQQKLQSLGFDTARLVGKRQESGWSERPLSKGVLLVLELNGPAYQEYLTRARRHALTAEANYTAAPNSDDLKRQAGNARQSATQAENEASRLFVVDAGTELAELRAKYPDRARYAIVHGQVRPWAASGDAGGGGVKVQGFIDEVSNASVNIPYAHRSAFVGENSKTRNGSIARTGSVTATIAFGKRLEPWVVALTRTGAAQ